jgi:hypothetical protein
MADGWLLTMATDHQKYEEKIGTLEPTNGFARKQETDS